NGERNRGCHDQGAAPTAQEQQDHQRGEAGSDHRLFDHALYRRAHEDRLIEHHLQTDAWRQGRSYRFERGLDTAHDVDGGGVTALQHGQQYARLTVLRDEVGLHGMALMDEGHVTHSYDRAVDRFNRQVIEIFDDIRLLVRQDVIFAW